MSARTVDTTKRSGTGVSDGDSPTPPRGGLCSGTTKYGRPCPNRPQADKDVCWHHDEANAERRKRNAVAGGRAVHSPATQEINELKDELRALVRDVKEGVVVPGVGAVLNQLLNSMLRAVETERKVREQDEHGERLAALEDALERRRGGFQRPAA